FPRGRSLANFLGLTLGCRNFGRVISDDLRFRSRANLLAPVRCTASFNLVLLAFGSLGVHPGSKNEEPVELPTCLRRGNLLPCFLRRLNSSWWYTYHLPRFIPFDNHATALRQWIFGIQVFHHNGHWLREPFPIDRIDYQSAGRVHLESCSCSLAFHGQVCSQRESKLA